MVDVHMPMTASGRPAAGSWRAPVRGDLGDAGRRAPTSRFPHGTSSFASQTTADPFVEDTYGFSQKVFVSSDINEEAFKTKFESFITTFTVRKATSNSSNEQQPQQPTEEGWDDDIFGTFQNSTVDGTSFSQAPCYLQLLRQAVESLGTQHTSHDITDENTAPSVSSLSSVGQFRINLHHLQSAAPDIFMATLRSPADAIVFMDEVLASLASREYADLGLDAIPLKVSLFRHPHVTCMRDLDPKDIETLIALRGIVIRCSSVIPEMRTAVFRCTARPETAYASSHTDAVPKICGYEETVYLINGEVQEPLQCVKCSAKYSFELFHARCSFGNKQLLKIQESPETIPEGETPHTVMAYTYDELVDVAKPGDYIELTGIFRASGVRVVPRMRSLKSVYRTYIDANSIYKGHLNRFLLGENVLSGPAADADLSDDALEIQNFLGNARATSGPLSTPGALCMTPELIEHMKQLGRDPNIYEKLVQSLAPNIWECDDVKKGLLCQLFGGTSKSIGGRASRNDIHVLLCGDPSTAKSQLLKYVHGIAPRGVYTCGRGSSAVGLTASVSRDPETKEFVLESGAIVLSDRGICCIDEFDKMDETARIILHEVMEQQTVSIAKAGIVCSLNARTAILASANPINSRYDTRRSVVDNINLPPSLMSRFDLIYLMLDSANPKVDRALAHHLCQLYAVNRQETAMSPPLDRKTLAHYISYAREFCKPKISSEAGSFLIDAYVDLRQRGSDGTGKSLSATPRQLESLIRLSEALARMELAEWVTVKHVKEAVRLIQVATYAALVDPTTGRLDFEQLNSGTSGGSRARRDLLERLLLSCLNGGGSNTLSGSGMDKPQLATAISEKLKLDNEYPLDPNGRELDLLLRELEEFGTITRLHNGKYISQTTA